MSLRHESWPFLWPPHGGTPVLGEPEAVDDSAVAVTCALPGTRDRAVTGYSHWQQWHIMSRWHNSVSTTVCQRPNPRSRWKNRGFFSKLSWTLDAWRLLGGRHCVSTVKWRKPPIFNRNTSVVVSASDIDEMHSTNPVITGVCSINRGVGSVKRIYNKISGSPNTYIPLTLSLYSFLNCLQTWLRMGVRY